MLGIADLQVKHGNSFEHKHSLFGITVITEGQNFFLPWCQVFVVVPFIAGSLFTIISYYLSDCRVKATWYLLKHSLPDLIKGESILFYPATPHQIPPNARPAVFCLWVSSTDLGTVGWRRGHTRQPRRKKRVMERWEVQNQQRLPNTTQCLLPPQLLQSVKTGKGNISLMYQLAVYSSDAGEVKSDGQSLFFFC